MFESTSTLGQCHFHTPPTPYIKSPSTFVENHAYLLVSTTSKPLRHVFIASQNPFNTTLQTDFNTSSTLSQSHVSSCSTPVPNPSPAPLQAHSIPCLNITSDLLNIWPSPSNSVQHRLETPFNVPSGSLLHLVKACPKLLQHPCNICTIPHHLLFKNNSNTLSTLF